VHWLSPELSSGACFRQGTGGGCAGRRALDGPRDVAVTGDVALVASSGSNGVAIFRGGDQPAGAVADLAVSGDIESTAVYAAVPSAGAIVALARNIPPTCGFGFAPPPLPFKVGGPVPHEVPLHCFDANRDPLTYAVETPPALGGILGFRGDFAIYQGPGSNVPPRTDTFSVRASDGAESATASRTVELTYLAGHRLPPRGLEISLLDSRARMDRRGRIALRVRCMTDGPPCAVALALRRGRRVGRTSATLKAGATRRLRVKLSKRVRRSVRRHRNGVLLTAVATARVGDGRTDRAARRIRVRAKRDP
jgi:hypothetical protein